MITKKIRINQFSQKIIYAYLLIAAFGSILFSYIYSILPLSFLLKAGAIKDLLLFLLLFLFFLLLTIYFSVNGTVNKVYFTLFKPLVIFSFFFLMSSLKGHASLGTIILMCRRYYLPLLLFFFFIFIKLNIRALKRFILIIFYSVSIFGFIEYFLPVSFWDNVIQLPLYWIASGDRFGTTTVELSGRFVSYDLWFILGHTVRRMCSSFTEPTNFSSFMISCFFIFRNNKKVKILSILCCCFAISKAGLIVFFGLLPAIFLYERFSGKKRYDILYIIMLLFFVFISSVMYSFGLTIGPFSHIAGFYTGITNILRGNIFGYGIGTVGNYSDFIENRSIGGESGLGGMLAQCGIGAFFYISFLYNLIKIAQRNIEKNYNSILMIFAWTVICAFSESAFGASGNMLFFIFPALAVNDVLYEELEYKKNV